MLLEQVYELLKEQIIDRVYGPGDKLNIDAIAREMKVSSTPVREALARLVAEGSLRLCPMSALPFHRCRHASTTKICTRSEICWSRGQRPRLQGGAPAMLLMRSRLPWKR